MSLVLVTVVFPRRGPGRMSTDRPGQVPQSGTLPYRQRSGFSGPGTQVEGRVARAHGKELDQAEVLPDSKPSAKTRFELLALWRRAISVP